MIVLSPRSPWAPLDLPAELARARSSALEALRPVLNEQVAYGPAETARRTVSAGPASDSIFWEVAPHGSGWAVWVEGDLEIHLTWASAWVSHQRRRQLKPLSLRLSPHLRVALSSVDLGDLLTLAAEAATRKIEIGEAELRRLVAELARRLDASSRRYEAYRKLVARGLVWSPPNGQDPPQWDEAQYPPRPSRFVCRCGRAAVCFGDDQGDPPELHCNTCCGHGAIGETWCLPVGELLEYDREGWPSFLHAPSCPGSTVLCGYGCGGRPVTTAEGGLPEAKPAGQLVNNAPV